MYIYNEKALLRVEFNGGVLINKENFTRIEIDKMEVYFLLLIRVLGNKRITKKKVKELFGNKKINIKKLKKMGLIKKVKGKKEFQKNEIDKIVQDIKNRCTKVWENNERYLSAPLEMTIYPTLRCNLNCKFCFIKNKNNKCIELDANKWIDVIKEGKDMGLLSVSILGGEPTLYSDIDELLEGIERIGIKSTITTNGVYMKDTTHNIIVNSDNIIPVFSLQALNDKHKILTGIEYTTVLKTMNDLMQCGKKIRVNSVYTEQSLTDFYEIIDFCVKNGIERYSIAAYVSANEDNSVNNVRTYREVRVLDEKLQEYIKSTYGEIRFCCSVEGCMTFSAYPELENDIYCMSNFEKNYYGCRAGKSKIEIYNNGDVYPCICFENILETSSNILNESLTYIWDNDSQMKKLRNDTCKSETCNKCGFYEFCNGGCPVYKLQMYKEDYLEYKDPTCVMTMDV